MEKVRFVSPDSAFCENLVEKCSFCQCGILILCESLVENARFARRDSYSFCECLEENAHLGSLNSHLWQKPRGNAPFRSLGCLF